MKLAPHLLQAISWSIAVTTVTSSCQQQKLTSATRKEVTSGNVKPEKSKKVKTDKTLKYDCPNCGMG